MTDLADRIRAVAYLEGDFVLRSGRRSSFYLDKYRFETQPDLLREIGELLAARISEVEPDAVRIAGPELGAVALAASVHGIALETALSGYLHAFTANLISAALRTVPLGQTDGQIALAALEASVGDTVRTAVAVESLDDVGTATPLLDWCSLRHETQYTRLFRS